MKWRILALINLVWSLGYAAEAGEACQVDQPQTQMYTLQLSDGQVKVGENFINSFVFTKTGISKQWGDKTIVDLTDIPVKTIISLHNLLKQETEVAVLQEFNRLKLEDQIELLKIVDFLDPQNTILGRFEYESNNYLVRQLVVNLQQQIESQEIDQEYLNELNDDSVISNIIKHNLYEWKIHQRLGEVDNEVPAQGNTSWITSVAISQDGQMIVTGSDDRTAIIWRQNDAGVWQIHQRLGKVDNEVPAQGHTDRISSVAISQDGQMIVTGSLDHTALIWRQNDQGEWQIHQRLGQVDNRNEEVGHTNIISSVAISQNGRMIATGSWDTRALIWRQNDAGVWQMSQRLGQVDNEVQEQGHTGWITSVAISQNGQMIVTGSDDRTALIWEEFNLYDVNLEELAELIVRNQLIKYRERLERESVPFFYKTIIQPFQTRNPVKKKIGPGLY